MCSSPRSGPRRARAATRGRAAPAARADLDSTENTVQAARPPARPRRGALRPQVEKPADRRTERATAWPLLGQVPGIAWHLPGHALGVMTLTQGGYPRAFRCVVAEHVRRRAKTSLRPGGGCRSGAGRYQCGLYPDSRVADTGWTSRRPSHILRSDNLLAVPRLPRSRHSVVTGLGLTKIDRRERENYAVPERGKISVAGEPTEFARPHRTPAMHGPRYAFCGDLPEAFDSRSRV